MANSIFESVKRFIVKQFWPWFIQHAWPLIKEEVIAAVSQVLIFMRKNLEDFLAARNAKQQEDINAKAKEAESKAEAAMDEAEAARWRGKAEAYREQADNLRVENEELRKELERLMGEGIKDLRTSVDNINVELKESKTLEIGSRSIPLLGASEDDLE